MSLDEIFQRDGHLLLHCARVVDMAGDVEELGARVPLSAEAQEPRAAATADGGRDGHGLHVGDRRGAAKHSFEAEGEGQAQERDNSLVCVKTGTHRRQQGMVASGGAFPASLQGTR